VIYANYLNPIECHFSALSQLVVTNSDYLDWDALGYTLDSAWYMSVGRSGRSTRRAIPRRA
jgi:hypothetical protein